MALALLLVLTCAAPAGAAQVELMVVGKTKVLGAASVVPLKTATVKAGGRSCRVAGATALAALTRSRLALRLRDYGSCSRSTRDAGALYVRSVAGETARGSDGWVYKVGTRAGTAPAGDRGGPFGRGGLRDGQRVLWFWCRMGSSGSCQRTLVARPSTRAAAVGSSITVTVTGHDDDGRGVRIAGATVRLATATATTGEDGTATIAVNRPGQLTLTAERHGMVASFPEAVGAR